MLGFSASTAKTINTPTAQNASSKNYFDKLKDIIRSDKQKINDKYKEIKRKVKVGK